MIDVGENDKSLIAAEFYINVSKPAEFQYRNSSLYFGSHREIAFLMKDIKPSHVVANAELLNADQTSSVDRKYIQHLDWYKLSFEYVWQS